MAQTTERFSMACGKIEFSSDNASWSDISGTAQSISGLDQSRMSGEGYTQDGDTAVITFGKREPMTPTVTVIYSENDVEGWELARAEHEAACGDAIYIRWSPGGGDIGDQRYYTPLTKITNFQYPPLDAGDGSPIKCSFQFKVAYVTTETIAS